jgi:HK97 family phage major capsid protein
MNSETTNLVEDLTRKKLERASARRPITRAQLREAMRQTIQRMEAQRILGEHPFSFARAIRGMCAIKHNPLIVDSAETDAEYTRALQAGTTPGSYLVPVAQADAVISQLSQLAVARSAGARIFPCAGIEFLNVPAAIAGTPSFVWLAMNSRQAPTDPNLAQITFTLRLAQALILLPVQLFRDALPQWNAILEDSFALGCAEAEDQAMWASSTLSVDAPKALMSQAGLTVLNAAGGAASGGALAYGDLLAVLKAAVDAKVRPPFAWFMNPRTWLRILSINDTASRPIITPGPEGVGMQCGHLLGWPVFLTSSIPVNEAVSSGTNQSHIVFTNPRNISIAESGEVTLEASTDFALDSAQVAVRVGRKVDFGYQPSAGLIVLQGVN